MNEYRQHRATFCTAGPKTHKLFINTKMVTTIFVELLVMCSTLHNM